MLSDNQAAHKYVPERPALSCPTCGKHISRRRLKNIEADRGSAAMAFPWYTSRQHDDDSFYREQAIQQAVERIAFFWAGNHINENTAWGLIRRLVPDAHAAEMAAIYGTGVAARRKWGLVPAKELRVLRVGHVTEEDILRAINGQDDDDGPEPEAA